jgi:aminoglycoside 3-N-acetyltransferase
MSNTFIHGIEEWYDVPGRLEPEPLPLFVKDYDGTIYPTPMRGHTHPWDSMQPWESEHIMIAAGAVIKGKFGNADCLFCDAKKLSDKLGGMIQTGVIWE